jgi:putative ABC transport system permease protein
VRGWPRVPGVQWLDVKLASRMLIRYPGLSIVGGLALTIGIPVSLAPIHLINAFNTLPPIEEPHRVLGIEHRDLKRGFDAQPTIYDFERWREAMTSFDVLAATRWKNENVIGDNGLVDIVRGAEITASAFTIARVGAQLGRTLIETDELKGAEPVVVIGHELWQRCFNSAPDVLGRTLQFGRVRRTVVGVMPPGFLFPYRDQFWVPLQARAIDYDIGLGPKLWIFGRLRDGVSRDQAEAEAKIVGLRIATEQPDTHAYLRPDVVTYTKAMTDLGADYSKTYPVYLLSLLLLAVACGNVSTLTLARAATRSNEIAVRTALGAGRGRIVMQLFVESLVLATLAATVGLVLGELAVRRLARLEAAMPYWFDLSVTPLAVGIAAGLALFSAFIAGVLPALRATGKRSYQILQRQNTGAGLRFGAVATVLIVVEVAIAVGGLSGVASVGRGVFRPRSLGDITADEYLTTELRLVSREASMNAATQADLSKRLGPIQEELFRRLSAEPGVRAVSFATDLPGMHHGRAQIELEGDARASDGQRPAVVNFTSVDRGFFEALGQRVTGRDFHARDLDARPRPVIVNRSFVDKVLAGRHPLGRRLRYFSTSPQAPPPWREIIGVVDDLGMNVVDPEKAAGVYHVIAPGQAHPQQLVVRVSGDAIAFVPRLRSILTAVEPGLVLENPVRLDQIFNEQLWQARFTSVAFASIAVVAVVLSAAGLYALMAFSVSQRTREIAIRATLGAKPSIIVRSVVGRALVQLAAGVAIGAWLATVIVPEVMNSFTLTDNWRQMMAAVSVAMVVIGLLACVAPIRRALRIDPVQALRD